MPIIANPVCYHYFSGNLGNSGTQYLSPAGGNHAAAINNRSIQIPFRFVIYRFKVRQSSAGAAGCSHYVIVNQSILDGMGGRNLVGFNNITDTNEHDTGAYPDQVNSLPVVYASGSRLEIQRIVGAADQNAIASSEVYLLPV